MRSKLLLLFLASTLLAACGETIPPEPEFTISRIEFTEEPIETDQPIPEFITFFETGSSVIYSYIWFQNTETLTGAFKVQMSWFYPNDLRPPIARHEIEMEQGQDIAQFSLHNEGGLSNGPYKVIIRAGLADSQLTESGSARLFVGMAEEDATKYLEEEAEFMKKRDEERARKEVERKKQEEEQARLDALYGTGGTMTGETMGGSGEILGPLPEGQEGTLGTLGTLGDELPPDLVGGGEE